MAENSDYDGAGEINNTEPESGVKRLYNFGGITCCVPLCYNNNKRNNELSFYVIPSEKTLRQKWLNAISRMDFKPTAYHRVCSAHFVGGRKTYTNNVPTIVPKSLKLSVPKKRDSANSFGLRTRNTDVPNKEIEVHVPNPPCEEITLEEILRNEITELKITIKYLEQDIQTKSTQLTEKDQIIAQNKFSVDRFKHNREHFKFYTGFESYAQFMRVLEYLKPAASRLTY